MDEFLSPLTDPMTVHVVEGEIVVLGPNGVAVSLTIEAAAESGRRLTAAVELARAEAREPPGRSRPAPRAT